MQIHGNAKTTPRSRYELVHRVEHEGHAIEQVARAFGISRPTVRKWLRRWNEEGPRGLLDRSSAPHHIPHRTCTAIERRIARLRLKRWVAWRIARALELALSTVSAVLRRLGLGQLSALEPQPPAPRRYERETPGELLHVDIKKLGRIKGIGHRITGIRRHGNKGFLGWEYAHVCVDDHTRLAYVEVLDDERKESCSDFLVRAVRWFRQQQIQPESVMTDNGSGYRSKLWRDTCEQLDLRHLTTRPYTPRTNGKAERFIQSCLREWAYASPFTSSQQRRDALREWLRYYNTERPHRGIGMRPPRQRLRDARKQRT